MNQDSLTSQSRPALTSQPSEVETQLTHPTNTGTKRIFVAATRMNDGKTTTCLGLYAALRALYPEIGFIKPIGQRFVKVKGHLVDEDSFLLDTIYHVNVPIESMSPVTVDATFTRRYLEDPQAYQPILADKISRAFDRVSWEKDFTIIEGTGHAGVGSVFDLSNARVAKMVGAKVIIVAQGGIGRPVDEIALNKALFDQEGVEVIGAILNKVTEEKIPAITHYARMGLQKLGIPLLGVIPNKKTLSSPNLSQIVEEIDGRWINGEETGKHERIRNVMIGAMTAKGISEYLIPGTLIITPGDRNDIILEAIANSKASKQKSASSLILTRDIIPDKRLMKKLSGTNIPVIAVDKDSYTIASEINRMTVKTQPEDSDKIPIIKKLILENIDLDYLLNALQGPSANY
jgi:BioD-like phosphotransacetylase family protein